MFLFAEYNYMYMLGVGRVLWLLVVKVSISFVFRCLLRDKNNIN